MAEEHFYGPLTWVAVQRITLPVYIFFRSISSLLIHHCNALIHLIDLTLKTDFIRLCCSSIAGRDPTYLKMRSPALLNLSRIVMLTQSDEGVWRLYTWSRVLNTYCIEKTLRLRIFRPCPLSLSTEVKSKLNYKVARKYFVKVTIFATIELIFTWMCGNSCIHDWLWFNSRQCELPSE